MQQNSDRVIDLTSFMYFLRIATKRQSCSERAENHSPPFACIFSDFSALQTLPTVSGGPHRDQFESSRDTSALDGPRQDLLVSGISSSSTVEGKDVFCILPWTREEARSQIG
jgi:hypothetical protein